MDPVARSLVTAILATVIASSQLACGGQFATPLECPKQGGAPWVEAQSRHFTLKTDVSRDEATARLDAFEGVYDLLEQVAFPDNGVKGRRQTVILFAREQDFRELTKSGVRAYYRSRLPQDFETSPTLVMYGRFDDESREVFTHELTHALMFRAFPSPPVWLGEGLAVYFSTTRIEGNRAVLGGFASKYAIEPSLIPSVTEIVHAPREAFYGTAGYEARSRDSTIQQTAYYAGAWHLVHMLRNGNDTYRARFDVLANALERGDPARAAWAAFAKPFDDATLEGDFRSYITAERSDFGMELTPRRTPRPVPSYRGMGEDEIHLLWARLLPWSGTTNDLAMRELERAEEHGGDTAAMALWHAQRLALAGRAEAATRALETQLAKTPNDPELLYARAAFAMRALPDSGASAAEIARLAKVISALEAHAVTSDERLLVAAAHMMRRESDAALIGASKALEGDPLCWACHAVIAEAHYQIGDFVGAVQSGERALALVPEDTSDPSLAKALARYREAANAVNARP